MLHYSYLELIRFVKRFSIFLMFCRFYDFNLDKTLFFFTAGRYEFMNKGADLFIEALSRLNHYMQATNSDKTVIAFLIFPARTHNFNVDSLRGQAITKQLRETINEIQNKVGKKMYEICLRYVVSWRSTGTTHNR